MPRYQVEIPTLELAFMNEDHEHELALMEEVAAGLAAADGPSLRARLDALAEHTRAHFEREEVVMRAVQFPAYPVHKAEHDRVLGEIQAEAAAYLEKGDSARLVAYLDGVVAGWFRSHMATMDNITARFAASAGKR